MCQKIRSITSGGRGNPVDDRPWLPIIAGLGAFAMALAEALSMTATRSAGALRDSDHSGNPWIDALETIPSPRHNTWKIERMATGSSAGSQSLGWAGTSAGGPQVCSCSTELSTLIL